MHAVETGGGSGPGNKAHLGKNSPWTFAQHFDELANAMPELQRLKFLYDLVCVAGAIRISHSADLPLLAYFLRDYAVEKVPTPTRLPLIELRGVLQRNDKRTQLIYLSGGIQLRAQIQALKEDGDLTALRDIVLKTRTSSTALTWRLPLLDWAFPNTNHLDPLLIDHSAPSAREADKIPGCCVKVQGALLVQAFSQAGVAALAADKERPSSYRFVSPLIQNGGRIPGFVNNKSKSAVSPGQTSYGSQPREQVRTPQTSPQLDVARMTHNVPELGNNVEEHNQDRAIQALPKIVAEPAMNAPFGLIAPGGESKIMRRSIRSVTMVSNLYRTACSKVSLETLLCHHLRGSP